jgi:hypothetical protein
MKATKSPGVMTSRMTWRPPKKITRAMLRLVKSSIIGKNAPVILTSRMFSPK